MLRSDRLLLRPAGDGDVNAVTRILCEPEVARWWGSYDSGRVREELADTFVIELDGETVGWLQAHEQRDPDFPSVAFDIALTTSAHGRGYGQEALRAAIRHYVERGHHRFTIDPAADNERAIRAYEAVGFKPVGILRAYERASDGGWRDGLLMDLLASDLH